MMKIVQNSWLPNI